MAWIQPQNLRYLSGWQSRYSAVETNKVPCQVIHCLPSRNNPWITPTILKKEMDTKKQILYYKIDSRNSLSQNFSSQCTNDQVLDSLLELMGQEHQS